jgi:hypothetical protein
LRLPRYDPALFPPRNGRHLVAGDEVPHLVRDRGACLRRAGRARRDPERRREDRSGTRAADATFDIGRIDEIERETKHDVIAFLTHLAEIVGPEARFVHQGMTSSDVLDTCFNVQLTRAADLLLEDIDALLAALKRRAYEHKDTVCIGRSHGIHAEPTTFGLKLARPMPSSTAARRRLAAARARKSPPAPSPALSAPSPTSTRALRTCGQGWA